MARPLRRRMIRFGGARMGRRGWRSGEFGGATGAFAGLAGGYLVIEAFALAALIFFAFAAIAILAIAAATAGVAYGSVRIVQRHNASSGVRGTPLNEVERIAVRMLIMVPVAAALIAIGFAFSIDLLVMCIVGPILLLLINSLVRDAVEHRW